MDIGVPKVRFFPMRPLTAMAIAITEAILLFAGLALVGIVHQQRKVGQNCDPPCLAGRPRTDRCPSLE